MVDGKMVSTKSTILVVKWLNGEIVKLQFMNGGMVKPQENLLFATK